MKVLIQSRGGFSTAVAGDSIQLIKTKEALEKMKVDVVVNSNPDLNLSEYDLVHLFNLIPVEETYRQYCNAKKQNKPMVLSTIFWDPVEYFTASGQDSNFASWWQRTNPLRQEILNGVNVILPNSELELQSLKKNFNKIPLAVIVPNAADTIFIHAKPDRFKRKYRIQDFVLSVGRICRRKNQLLLIEAAKKFKLPLVLIGPLNDGEYYQECRQRAAGHKVLFIDTLAANELAGAYAAARVHALVSWYDTPGLVSLEAALAGCKLVSTNRGSAVEYFGELAYYCDPGNLNSVCEAIYKAWSAPKNNLLKERVLQNFTWEKAARQTIEAYKRVLE